MQDTHANFSGRHLSATKIGIIGEKRKRKNNKIEKGAIATTRYSNCDIAMQQNIHRDAAKNGMPAFISDSRKI